MAEHNERGKEGEKLAAEYYLQRGFELLEKNWRSGHWEIDLIVSKEGILRFIEVKLRTTSQFGMPEENVSRKKILNLINASVGYLRYHPQWKRVQFDVLAISIMKGQEPEYFLIEDVYAW